MTASETERLSVMSAVLNELLQPSGIEAAYEGAPNMLYFMRVVNEPSDDGLSHFLIDTEDGWASYLLKARDAQELREAALVQMKAVGWLS